MKKLISFLTMLFLSTVSFAEVFDSIEKTENQENNENMIFLSLTKYAEPIQNLGTNVTIITAEKIQEKKAKNLGDIVNAELGISYKSNGPLGQSQSIYMRGATAGQTLVLIDGRPVNDAALGVVDYTSIPANIIEKIEIIRGAGCAMYGTGAFGGVINVITKKATPFMSNVNPYFSYRTFNTINAGITGAYANDIVSILAAPSLLSSDGYKKNSFYDSKNIFAKIAIKLTDNSEFILSGQAYNADIGNPGSLSYPTLSDKQLEDNNYYKLDYKTKINDFDIQVSGYNSNSARQSYSYGYLYNFDAQNTGIKGNLSYKNILFAGLEWDKSVYEDATMKPNRENSAGYLQSFFNIGNLTLVPVVRYDTNTDYDDVFTPAMSAIFKATDEIKLSANVSKIWNAPTFNQLFYNDDAWLMYGDPNLKPEEGVSSDIGIEYTKNKFSVALTGFYITTKNLISWYYDSSTWTTQAMNIDETRQYGCEFGVNYNMSNKIQHKLNYTYLRAEDTKLKQDLYYRPMHNINYAITIKPIHPLKLTADVSYVTSTRYATGGDFLKDYCLVNVRTDYEINKNISFWAKCDNLTNQDYQLTYDYPMAGIVGYTGIDIKF